MIKDSFANSVIPFMTNNYENIVMIDLRYIKRRYFAGVLSLEESIRRKLSSK